MSKELLKIKTLKFDFKEIHENGAAGK